MKKAIQKPADKTISEAILQEAGRAADKVASRKVIQAFRNSKSSNTLRAHDGDLEAFRNFLLEVTGVDVDELNDKPSAWKNITFGLVEAFKNKLLQDGYAIKTVNRRVSTIKEYAELAHQAGAIDTDVYTRIKAISTISYSAGVNIDEKRETTRIHRADGSPVKKAENTRLSRMDVIRLKRLADDSPQALRDSALMCLLLEHGLRCSEVALLKTGDVNLEEGTLKFYRPKVKKVQTHYLTEDTLEALRAYFKFAPADADAPLLRASRKNSKLDKAGMSTRAITKRVNALGEDIGISGLSAHDCRHSWATRAGKKSSPFALQEAGGWKSLAMPRRYIDERKVANEGIILS